MLAQGLDFACCVVLAKSNKFYVFSSITYRLSASIRICSDITMSNFSGSRFISSDDASTMIMTTTPSSGRKDVEAATALVVRGAIGATSSNSKRAELFQISTPHKRLSSAMPSLVWPSSNPLFPNKKCNSASNLGFFKVVKECKSASNLGFSKVVQYITKSANDDSCFCPDSNGA